MLSIALPGQKIPGFPKAKRPRSLATMELPTLLSSHWKEDVHFVQYGVIDQIGPYRYNNELFSSPAFEDCKKAGIACQILCIAFDVDSPAKKSGEAGAIDIWFEEERPKIDALLQAHPGGMVWRTKGGWRGVWYCNYTLATIDDTFLWKKDYLSAIVYLERAFGIIADSACNDWNRLHRVPFGIRENEPQFAIGEPIIRETIGKLDSALCIELPSISTDADRQEAKRRNLSAWKSGSSVVSISKHISKADEPAHAPCIEGPFVWEKLLRSRSAILRELAPGKFAIKCANESSHSSQSDTSTVLYAPGPGEYIGHIYCAHAHCAGLDWRSAWGIAPPEWAAALAEVLATAPAPLAAPNASLDPAASWESASAAAVAGLVQGRDCLPAPIAGNVAHILLNHPEFKGKLAYDNFRNERIWLEFPKCISQYRNSSISYLQCKSDIVPIQSWFYNNQPRIAVSPQSVKDGLEFAAEANRVDTLRDYVMSHMNIFDGTPRLDSWLIDYMGADDTTLNRVIGKKWLIAAIARALIPGCVADMMIILEGLQGIGKNRVLDILFGPNNVVSTHGLKIGTKDFMQNTNAWCVHDDEIVSLKSCSIDDLKAWVSIKVDKFRKANAEDFIMVDRRFVIAGTTNKSDYLNDSESRRFWPVHVRHLKEDALIRDRDQLISEALCYFTGRQQAVTWLIKRHDEIWGELNEVHSTKREEDSWEILIKDMISSNKLTEFFKITDVYDLLQLTPDKQTKVYSNRIGQILRMFGFSNQVKWGDVNGRMQTIRGWCSNSYKPGYRPMRVIR